jgi:hypothetical protein
MSQSAVSADPNYAESVAMTGHAEDAATTFDVRVARFPAEDRGTLWLYAYVDGRQFALVDETVELVTPEITNVALPDAAFEVFGRSSAKLRGIGRHTAAMQGQLTAQGLLHPLAHPEPGVGSIPVEIAAELDADHRPINVRPGRVEVMGRVQGTITIAGAVHSIDLPGKWHEQTGIRQQFAPAFTYLFVQGDGIGIMATKHANGAWGYVYRENTTTPITEIDIESYGTIERKFSITLQDGGRIEGAATIVREVSVPIEGKRRPGSTIVVESDIGRLVGVLNDWDPT